MNNNLPNSVWTEWEIVEKIGEGSFGKVYKAQRIENGRSFCSAIKIISIPSSETELGSVQAETGNIVSTRKYFENIVDECIQEVITMENFRGNTQIVSVEDFKVIKHEDEIKWDIYIRMEYVQSFVEYCTGKKISEKEVIKLGIDICKALEYCEQINIIHRDIKPENIFVSRFQDFKLGDFGIARKLERTMSNYSKKGTDSYMAPEIYKGQMYDISADIYSLGLVLYKLMNKNRLPFLNLEKQFITYRDKEAALNKRMCGEKLPPPLEAKNDLAKIILKACEYNVEKRYKSPRDLRKDLERILEKELKKEDRSAYIKREEMLNMEPTTIIYKKNKQYKGNLYKQNTYKVNEYKPEREEKRERDYRRTRDPIVTVLSIAVVIIAIATCILIGFYIRLISQNNVSKKTEEMVQMLEEQKNNVLNGDKEIIADAIANIDEKILEIANNLNDYAVSGNEGERLCYYDEEGNLRKVLVYPALSEEKVYEEYYYWGHQPIMAYIWKDNKEDMYYYDDGNLIRWIDSDNTCHDMENDMDEYVTRGDRYWSNAVSNNVQ